MTPPDTKMPSNRRFGLLFTAVFLLFALHKAYTGGSSLNISSLIGASLTVGFATAFAPHLLLPFNKAWFHFGRLLGKLVSPIVLGIIFFGILTPIAVIARIFGRDELRLRPLRVNTYWVDRLPAGPDRNSFKNQW
jgi:hypothetical protein